MSLLDEVKRENNIQISQMMLFNNQNQYSNKSHMQIRPKAMSRTKNINQINNLSFKQLWVNNLEFNNLKQIIKKLQHKLQSLGQCQYVKQLFLEIQKLQINFLKKYRQIIIIQNENNFLKNKIQNISSNKNNELQNLKQQIQPFFQEENNICSKNQQLKQLQKIISEESSNQNLINYQQIDNTLTCSTPKHQIKQSNTNVSFYFTKLNQPNLNLENNRIRSMTIAKQSTKQQQNTTRVTKLEVQNQLLSQKIKFLEGQLYSTQRFIQQFLNSNSSHLSVKNNIKVKNQQIESLNLYIQKILGQLQQKDICLKKKELTIQQLGKGIQQLDNSRNIQNEKYKNIIESKNNQLNNLCIIYKRKIQEINFQLQKSNQIVVQMKILINKYQQVEEINQQLMAQINKKQQETHIIILQNQNLKLIIKKLQQSKPHFLKQKLIQQNRYQDHNKNKQIKMLINDFKNGLNGNKQPKFTPNKLIDSMIHKNKTYNSHSMFQFNKKSGSNIQIKKSSTNTICFDNLNQKETNYVSQNQKNNNFIYTLNCATYKKQPIKPAQRIEVTNRQDNKCQLAINIVKGQKMQYIEKKLSNFRKQNKKIKRELFK